MCFNFFHVEQTASIRTNMSGAAGATRGGGAINLSGQNLFPNQQLYYVSAIVLCIWLKKVTNTQALITFICFVLVFYNTFLVYKF